MIVHYRSLGLYYYYYTFKVNGFTSILHFVSLPFTLSVYTLYFILIGRAVLSLPWRCSAYLHSLVNLFMLVQLMFFHFPALHELLKLILDRFVRYTLSLFFLAKAIDPFTLSIIYPLLPSP